MTARKKGERGNTPTDPKVLEKDLLAGVGCLDSRGEQREAGDVKGC